MINTTALIKWVLIIFCALALAGFLFFRQLGSKSAAMIETLGVTNGQLAAMPDTPNAVSSQTDIASKYVAPLPMTGSVQETKEKILQCLQEMGHNSVVSQQDNYIHAVFVTPFMQYHDDVEFYIDTATNLVQFRSASRVGKSDFGANKARYATFKKLYLPQ